MLDGEFGHFSFGKIFGHSLMACFRWPRGQQLIVSKLWLNPVSWGNKRNDKKSPGETKLNEDNMRQSGKSGKRQKWFYQMWQSYSYRSYHLILIMCTNNNQGCVLGQWGVVSSLLPFNYHPLISTMISDHQGCVFGQWKLLVPSK